MSYFALIFLSLLPSALWLIFFLREDKHPEPGNMILKVFFYGMMFTIPVILISLLFNFFLSQTNISEFAMKIIMIVFIASFTEETAKYMAVKKSALYSSECDEPVDVMIYAITAALGFAALENILFLFPLEIPFSYSVMASESFFRFISGTFLHALASALMGYFLAVSILNTKKRKFFVFVGLSLAIVLHALYNFSIMMSETKEHLLIIAPVILISLFITVFFCFKKLRKIKSVCNYN